MDLNLKKMEDALDEALKNITPEELKKYFPSNKRPKGWFYIDEHLPYMLAKDLFTGGTPYKVKYKDGSEGISYVMDHNTWYYEARDEGITHWWHN